LEGGDVNWQQANDWAHPLAAQFHSDDDHVLSVPRAQPDGTLLSDTGERMGYWRLTEPGALAPRRVELRPDRMEDLPLLLRRSDALTQHLNEVITPRLNSIKAEIHTLLDKEEERLYFELVDGSIGSIYVSDSFGEVYFSRVYRQLSNIEHMTIVSGPRVELARRLVRLGDKKSELMQKVNSLLRLLDKSIQRKLLLMGEGSPVACVHVEQVVMYYIRKDDGWTFLATFPKADHPAFRELLTLHRMKEAT
jgi:hypothetical protein